MRTVLVAATMLVGMGATKAQDNPLEAAAFHIATAYACQHVTGDTERYDEALRLSHERLIESGDTNSSAQSAINEIVSHMEPLEENAITEQLCIDLLHLME